MDLLSHGVWTGIIFARKKLAWWAVMFGMLPDLLAFTPYILVRAINGGIQNIFITPLVYPEWVIMLYNSTHSLVIAGLIFTVLIFWRQDLGILFLAWPLHILFDIPTHSAETFPTKFLYPLSHLYFDGLHWKNWYIFFGNWTAIALTYCIFILYRKYLSQSYEKS